MKREEFRNKVHTLTKKEQYYKNHPEKTDFYLKTASISDTEFYLTLTPQDKKDVVEGHHAIFYDGQNISDDMLDLPILCTKQTRYSFVPIHKRAYVEIKYVYSGHCYAVINDKEVLLHAGDLIILDQDSSHTILPPKENDLIFNFQMNRDYFKQSLISKFNASGPIVTFLTSVIDNDASHDQYVIFKNREDDTHEMKIIVENILMEYLEPTPFAKTIIESYLLLLFIRMTQRYQANMEDSYRKKNKSYITEIITYIQQNFATCTLKEVSELFGYNQDYLSRTIQNATGLTFKKLIMYYRMENASYALINTDKPIYQISQDCGFTNLNYFYKKFEEYFGGTPQNYRKQLSTK